jgi:hypothetical protein
VIVVTGEQQHGKPYARKGWTRAILLSRVVGGATRTRAAPPGA